MFEIATVSYTHDAAPGKFATFLHETGFDTHGNWHQAPRDPEMIASNAGDMLDMATQGDYSATVHRVVNPPVARNVARFSMPMFLHPRREVVLEPGVTAHDFLMERLREIGLKS